MVSSLDNSLFRIIITDDSGETPTVYSGYQSSLAWVLLSEFESNYFIYDWTKLVWKSITWSEFTKYHAQYQSVIIQAGQSKSNWLETPMTRIKILNNSKVTTKNSKLRRIEPINSYFRSSQTESSLRQCIETERLLEELDR
jgi:hypothetical protein